MKKGGKTERRRQATVCVGFKVVAVDENADFYCKEEIPR